ncbi:Coiled-coil domain-containing protein [Armadillidium nasatum]|uniref:Vacuolar ATPase assembly protein VMA22 n=1 Tax=Armadillidium nasatum TaxID=96803 RepID=A0A5N5TKH8_9CRUS|nr:Coiled-coil domain-containing protein [Armadillidium nasatum]
MSEDLDKLDNLAVLRLELMDELIAAKKDLENFLREGYFLLGKSRYIMGVNAVSMLQVPIEDDNISSGFYTTVSKEPLSEMPSLTNHLFNIHIREDREESKDKVVEEKEVSLRKRKSESKLDDSEKEEVEVVKKENNPLNWFNALPPQSLRKAQEYFKKAIIKSVECATIQSKLNALNG